MAEVAGLVLSGIGLIALKDTVTECFSNVDDFKSFGSDYSHYVLQLDLARLAYERWLRSVKFCEPNDLSATSLPTATGEETEIVARLLGQIELAFRDARSKNKRYASTKLEPRGLETFQFSGEDMQVLADKARERSIMHHKTIKTLTKVRWVMNDARTVRQLSERVSNDVNSLVELFPCITRESEQAQATGSASMPSSIHPRSPAATSVQRPGTGTATFSHVYEENKVSGFARVLYGDQIAQGMQATNPGSRYVENEATDYAKAVYGNQYGMGNFLDG
ncbi:hypothetical protein BAUCODRAFT_148271 [Baudoinia panamericana UAMH 10762]|uniref:Prion-inhibition and propagation HeLo domain-containing protein n=1 Tax=Baudoinia panamericana (strain UAMH 10762) TaxID=717646 RepID=M2NC10_BAUPA|nr:uncharacterized protein BAUCODRAFT_148271 [Baudoinia panamericana UAMH 10762]EMC96704.1 hypothetical protein BAUCODRAFT_148271 [Baudoinia panamericana UAMH 10762]